MLPSPGEVSYKINGNFGGVFGFFLPIRRPPRREREEEDKTGAVFLGYEKGKIYLSVSGILILLHVVIFLFFFPISH